MGSAMAEAVSRWPVTVEISVCCQANLCGTYGGQSDPGILGIVSPMRINFMQWCLIFVSPHYGTCFVSLSWHTEF